MQIKEFLDKVCNEIKYKPIRKEISKELENHIEEAKVEYINKGEKENKALEKAIEDMGNAKLVGKSLNKIHKPKLDYKLIILVLILLCFTFMVSVIKTKNYLFSIGEIPFFIKTIIYIIIGIILGTIIYFIDYSKIIKYSNHIYIIAGILIIYTLKFSNYNINGIPHLNIGNIITISVNTISMPLFLIAFIGFIEKVGKNKLELEIFNRKKIIIDIQLLKTILLSLCSILLLFLIPSITSAFVLTITYIIVAIVKIMKSSKNKMISILKLLVLPVVIGIYIMALFITEPYRFERILISFKPELDPAGSGWVGINRKAIINSANLLGEADDIGNAIELFDEGESEAFISILAHYGWIPSIILVITIILISIKLIANSVKIKDCYGKMLIIGISCLFILQSIFNVLKNLNLWIEASFELPFVSYGGTGLIMNILCLALVLCIYRRKDIQVKLDVATTQKNYKIKIT